MDYEQRIKQLEESLRQEQETRYLQVERLEGAHDASFNAVREILRDTAQLLNQLAVRQDQLAIEQAKTESMLQDLIRAITGGPILHDRLS